MKTLLSILLSTLWMTSSTASEASREDWQIKSSFETAQTVILVRVVESTFPAVADAADDPPFPKASALVLRSWKGPFSTGLLLHLAPPYVCVGFSCQPYPVQAGDEVLIFTQGTRDPITVIQGMVFRAAESKSMMEVLDQTVKEQQQLHDPQTDIVRAPERQRILFALSRCLAESSRHQGDTTFQSLCLTIDTSVLLGIKRSELVAALGPPTWCQRLYPFAYLRGVGNDCTPEQTPVWSSEAASNTPGGLMCQPDASQRCMHMGWFVVAQ
jgi:hypothetical protein